MPESPETSETPIDLPPQGPAVVAEGPQDAVLDPIWVSNQVALAKALRCSRKTIERFLKIEGEGAPPAPSADGRYNVTAWKMWAQEHGRLQKQVVGDDKQSLELAGMRLANERREIENAVRRGELLHVDEVCKVLTELMGALVSGGQSLKNNVGPLFAGHDQAEITKRFWHQMWVPWLRRLSLGEWAKKKTFWSKPYAHLCALQTRYHLGDGPKSTS